MAYAQELQAKLEAAQERVKQGREMKALKAGAPALLDIIDLEISIELNRAFDKEPLTYPEYLESHGAVRGIKRIRAMMDSREVELEKSEVEARTIRENLENIQSNG